ncbi:MAG: glucoamylase family protein [Anaerolineae bacterium]
MRSNLAPPSELEAAEPVLPPLAAPPPLRGELLSVERLEQHARDIAARQHVVERRGDLTPLLNSLRENRRRLWEAYEAFAQDARDNVPVTPAAEWLLDNFPIVLEQIREIQVDLPQGYYAELPKLADGPLTGAPRVYALALELITHTDSRVDQEELIRFLVAYQSVTQLTMGELWAIAIMLRVGLVENLSRLAAVTLETRRLRHEADEWADRFLVSETPPGQEPEPPAGETDSPPPRTEPLLILADLARRYPELPSPFAVRLLQRLRGFDTQDGRVAPSAWLESYLNAQYDSTEALLNVEHQRQSANQASVANIITSMRTLSATNWAEWFEEVSPVEQVLRQEPAGVYSRCTFATRDRYRHEVERLARGARLTELDVAWRLVDKARQDGDRDVRRGHVGYYLIDRGRDEFEAQLGYRAPVGEAVRRTLMRYPTALYLGAIAGGTAAATAAGLGLARQRPSRVAGVAMTSLLVLPASQVAQTLVNWSVTKLLPPRVLPRLDLSQGIPEDLRTIVVVPMLLLTPESVTGQFDRLEVLSQANDDPNMHFALLSDFADAPSPEMPEDIALLSLARDRLTELNARYGEDRFLFFHRRRVWNPGQNCYMGWERKRGKLAEFNRLLRGATDTTFDVQLGDISLLHSVRYVITLDADTQLPREVGQTLVGILAHPLNQAVLDPETRCVVAGYGILQPRVGIDVISATRSRFAAIFSGDVGLDPYTRAVSDVYMDLFGEGIFAGKGIYDPHALAVALEGRFPENALLSHDLLEGTFARAGLVSDIELLDSYPTTYAAYAARLHRWIRGDWQISRWLLPQIPEASGAYTSNPLLLINRWKIFDNLRRSLLAPATVALLASAWAGLTAAPIAVTAFALSPLWLPLILRIGEGALSLPRATSPAATLRYQVHDLNAQLEQSAITLSFMLDEAALSLDAIGRTLWRLLVTHRNLLEWETAAEAERRLSSSAEYLRQRVALTLPVVAVLAVASRSRWWSAWPLALPVVCGWLASPIVAAWLDRPAETAATPLTDDDETLLRQIARQTWDFFATFVTEESHFLAPDNFQDDPRPVVAHRTSPTNTGLQLLSDMAAHDFGYIGTLEMTERTERVFTTLDRLERHRGHLLNWYDTRTLEPLLPAYVSTVDSGNLAGALIALSEGYAALLDRPIVSARALESLRDTLVLVQQEAGADPKLASALALLRVRLTEQPTTVAAYYALLRDTADRLSAIVHHPHAHWLPRLKAQADSLLRDLETLHPVLAPAALAEAVTGELAEADPPALPFDTDASLRDVLKWLDDALAATGNDPIPEEHRRRIGVSREQIVRLVDRHTRLIETARAWVQGMDFRFLYDDRRSLFSIGYNVTDGRLDNSFYDLLASEARLASFLAIAKGDVPQEHWFHMARPLTPADGGTALVSWSGTMFEYLMPLLWMRRYPSTLLDVTYHGVVAKQISYGRENKVPWGVSESAFNARDLNLNYQYRAFGVPGLGLKRGLGSDLVIAPYATFLALPIQPHVVVENVRALIQAAACGQYGLYEAIDYTTDRLPPGQKSAVVHCYMAHHQGMSLLSITNCLHENVMQRRFHDAALVKATELLLQEQFPRWAPRERLPEVAAQASVSYAQGSAPPRHFTTPNTAVPQAHLLSNGAYSVVVTNAGGGFSRYRPPATGVPLAVTRWREDMTRDAFGSFCYIRDARSGLAWSAAYQPIRRDGEDYSVTYLPEKAEFEQMVGGIQTRLEVAVSPEDNAEVRRISLTNRTSEPRELEVTSYAEIVLAPQGADQAHPAFSNLFIETEFMPDEDALLATRRKRSPEEPSIWAVHVVAVRGHTVGPVQYETDRGAFLGRGRGVALPQALDRPLAGNIGAVLDPIFGLRRHVRIVPGGTTQVIFTTGVTETREQAQQLADKYHNPSAGDRAFEMAWTQARVEMQHLAVSSDDAQHFQRLGSALVYMDPQLRAQPAILERNTRSQPGLWAYGISGDDPILLARIRHSEELPLVHEVLQAHQYLRLKGLTVDLVILNEHAGGYLQGLHEQIMALTRAARSDHWIGQRGGIHVVRGDTLPAADQTLLLTVARVVLSGEKGTLAQQLPRIHLARR